jgi:hypothetical protein
MIAVPAETAVTTPVLLTTATAVSLELNTMPEVRIAVVESLKDPTTVSWDVRPAAIELATDVTVTDSSAAAVTTICVVLLTPLQVPVMMAVPADTAVTTPVLLTTATAVLPELKTTPETKVVLVPLLNDPTAVI